MYKIDPILFDAFIKAVREVTGAVRMEFGPQITCQAIDTAAVGLISASVTPEEYTGDPVTLQVDISRMGDLPIESAVPVTLDYIDSQFVAVSGRVKYKIPLFVDAAVKKSPDLNKIPFPFGLSTAPQLIAEGVTAIKSITDSKDTSAGVRFTYDPSRDHKLILYDRVGECEVSYANNEYTPLGDVDRPFSAFYPLDYVSPYIRILKGFSLMTVKFGTNSPLLLGCKSAKLSIAYIVAPRVDPND